jgi:AcrR family transcriptional regulator
MSIGRVVGVATYKKSGETMGAMSADAMPIGVPERVMQATVELLAEQGPSAIKARTVAAAAGLSTMVVYSHFGGIAELMGAVVEFGYTELDRAFEQAPVTDDPIADLFALALTTRRIARANPHLYDLMFGLSIRATYRPVTDVRLSGQSEAFQSAYAHLLNACRRLVESGRIGPARPDVVAAALWSFVHGYITLEMGEHFAGFKDPVRQVMLPMGVTFTVGLGDSPERAQASHEAALHRYKAAERRSRSS